MNVFESKNYTTFMYISTIMVLLLILFNFVDIVEDKELDITNFVRFSPPNEDSEEIIESIEIQEELYSEKSYLIYYSILGLLGICIFLLSLRYLLPYFKNYT